MSYDGGAGAGGAGSGGAGEGGGGAQIGTSRIGGYFSRFPQRKEDDPDSQAED